MPIVSAMAVLPLLYVLPATRPLWQRHRYPLLAVQAALTCLPFALFGANGPGPVGVAGGPGPADGSVAGVVVRVRGPGRGRASRAGSRGRAPPPAHAAPALGVWAAIAFVLDALILFGLARLADLIAAVHAARDELAEAAVTAERLRAADSLRAAVGDRLAAAAGRAAAALQTIARNQSQAREHLAATAATARQALDDVREVTASYRDAARPDAVPAEQG